MKGKLIYTKQLGKSVALQAQSAKMGKLHVIAGDSNWKVVSEGSVKALRVFSTVEKAIDFAKNIASAKTGEVVVHEGNGKIKSRITYSLVK
ncbi:MAG: DUF2188 domain-containing protein [Bacteroidetes bacterium]|jgi:hypothetical protein|nr:DUF2188 domain-containing protein [Bacteroidota bacterium]HQW45502.1 DUF2188 domain-containing protein [Chitinophagaceae bacterium]MBK6818298.1 DUF2188 domain-containing protein [Bacteroidota bacterium]MBK7040483.1 DUF2188 domain-containing protein [Bacteroidota bacterium]MBK7587180.1 DUF2188 domain-containing protein [Bacteroidota bacterium]